MLNSILFSLIYFLLVYSDCWSENLETESKESQFSKDFRKFCEVILSKKNLEMNDFYSDLMYDVANLHNKALGTPTDKGSSTAICSSVWVFINDSKNLNILKSRLTYLSSFHLTLFAFLENQKILDELISDLNPIQKPEYSEAALRERPFLFQKKRFYPRLFLSYNSLINSQNLLQILQVLSKMKYAFSLEIQNEINPNYRPVSIDWKGFENLEFLSELKLLDFEILSFENFPISSKIRFLKTSIFKWEGLERLNSIPSLKILQINDHIISKPFSKELLNEDNCEGKSATKRCQVDHLFSWRNTWLFPFDSAKGSLPDDIFYFAYSPFGSIPYANPMDPKLLLVYPRSQASIRRLKSQERGIFTGQVSTGYFAEKDEYQPYELSTKNTWEKLDPIPYFNHRIYQEVLKTSKIFLDLKNWLGSAEYLIPFYEKNPAIFMYNSLPWFYAGGSAFGSFSMNNLELEYHVWRNLRTIVRDGYLLGPKMLCRMWQQNPRTFVSDPELPPKVMNALNSDFVLQKGVIPNWIMQKMREFEKEALSGPEVNMDLVSDSYNSMKFYPDFRLANFIKKQRKLLKGSQQTEFEEWLLTLPELDFFLQIDPLRYCFESSLLEKEIRKILYE